MAGESSTSNAIGLEDENIPGNVPISSTPLPMEVPDKDQRQAATQWANLIHGVGQRFDSQDEFREWLRKYSIAHGFNYVFKKNEKKRLTAECKAQGCPWRIHASKVSTALPYFCIKTMRPDHTCQGAVTAFRSDKRWISNFIKEKVKESAKIKPKDIAIELQRDYGIVLNYQQARRVKEYARALVLGSYEAAYNELPSFCQKIMDTNPGSLAIYNTYDDLSFRRLFVCFHASIWGFVQGCRQLLFLDSTPINSRYKGMLLTATAADGNDSPFVVAFGVVDKENDDNWHWFLTKLKNIVPTVGITITFVEDFQKGIPESLREIFPGSYHAYCLGYLAQKLSKDLSGHFSHDARRLMVENLYAAAYAPNLEAFVKCTEGMKAISPEVYNWVISSETDHWANAFFLGLRYNHMTSDFGSHLYSWVSEPNQLTITQIIDELRGRMMELIYTRRSESAQWLTRLTPSMEEKLKSEMVKASSVVIIENHLSKYKVRYSEMIHTVDMDKWDCSCNGLIFTGLPCCHVIALLQGYNRNPYDHCSHFFQVNMYQSTYAKSIHPIPTVERLADDETEDGLDIAAPPTTMRTRGRPKIKMVAPGRIGLSDFSKRKHQCSKCKGLGHNKRSCK